MSSSSHPSVSGPPPPPPPAPQCSTVVMKTASIRSGSAIQLEWHLIVIIVNNLYLPSLDSSVLCAKLVT